MCDTWSPPVLELFSLANPTLAHSPRVSNYGMSEIVWFPCLLWAVGSVGECSRVFLCPFPRHDLTTMAVMVYTRARAPHALYIYRHQQQQQQPLYTYTYTLHLLGFERSILVRTRDTLRARRTRRR
nr:MAG TPA: hypothetical protein [Caudoviricetes sp.]